MKGYTIWGPSASSLPPWDWCGILQEVSFLSNVADDEVDRHMDSMGPLVAVAAALADDRPSDSFVGSAAVDT